MVIGIHFVLTIATNGGKSSLAAGQPKPGGVAFAGEVLMPDMRRETSKSHGFVAPVVWIGILLSGYWLIAGWSSVPGLIHSAIATIR